MTALQCARSARVTTLSTQVVEAELGIRTVRHIGFIGGDALGRGAHPVLDQADLHAQEAIDGPPSTGCRGKAR